MTDTDAALAPYLLAVREYRQRVSAARATRSLDLSAAEQRYKDNLSAAADDLAERLNALAEDEAAADQGAPAPTAPAPEPPKPAEPVDARAELKRECLDLEQRIINSPMPGGDSYRMIRESRQDCGLDPDRATESSKASAAKLGDYRAELTRRLRLFEAARKETAPAETAAEPAPAPEPVAAPKPPATSSQLSLQEMF